MNTPAQFAVIAAISLAAAGVSWLLKPAPAEKTAFVCDPAAIREDEICLADVKGNVLWVDARPRGEWQKNGLKGSILWSMDPGEDANLFEAEAAPHIAAAELVVVYCGSEKCGTSREVADRIRRLGFGPEVKALHGGWDALRGSSSAP
jgi:rhodanese-related sulfurtransferase